MFRKNPWAAPTPAQIAEKQLNDARVQLLEAEAHREYYESLCQMLTQRVSRLEQNTNVNKVSSLHPKIQAS